MSLLLPDKTCIFKWQSFGYERNIENGVTMDTGNSAHKGPTAVKTVFIVEDDEAIGTLLVQVIEQETSYQAVLAPDGFQALKMLRTVKPDVLILDYGLPDMNGLEFYDTIHVLSAQTARIQKEVKARHLPQLQKPFELTILLEAIERLFSRP
ncbi:MAG: response regulator [Chloroflexi bacterium]|nr:MAG: response regulator [Chloroflexota bacterium]